MSPGRALLVAVTAACVAVGVSAPAQAEPVADAHTAGDFDGLPGNGRAPDPGSDTFSFAVFSDLTGGERPGVFEVAVAQLSLLRPDLVLNVGDLIEGGDDPQTIARQWEDFESRLGAYDGAVFHTGGNHDLLGKAMRGAWEERLGPRHYHFVYRDVLFLVLDTDDYAPDRLAEIAQLRREAFAVADEQGWDAFAETAYARLPENPAGEISRSQADDVLAALAAHPEVRWTFVLMHKAPWLRPEMDSWRDIEAALAGRRHTVFHGHEHAYRHQRRNGADVIQLGTTGGVPLPENGLAMDHLVWVTVDGTTVHIANLALGGILDVNGRVPAGGHETCFERALCDSE